MLFRKLFFTYLLVAVTALLISGAFAGYLVWRAAGTVELERAEFLARELAASLAEQEMAPEALRQAERVMATLLQGELTSGWVIDPQRIVLAAAAGTSPGVGEYLPLSLPGARGPGRRVPLVSPVPGGREHYPAAVQPVTLRGGEVGAVVLSPSLTQVRKAQNTILRFILRGSITAAFVLALVSYYISQRISRPVAQLSRASRAVARGDFSARVEWQSADEVGGLAMAFNQMAADLNRLELSRRDLMATVSHELKGPLARITGYMEAVHDGIDGEEGKVRHLGIVRREVARLTRLVNDLLDYSRLEAGRLKLYLIPCDLAPYLTRAAEVFEAPARAAGVTYTIAIPGGLPVVECEPERIEQVLANLVENGLAHTPPGGRLTVTAQETDGWLQVSVRDTGAGINEADLQRVWEQFVKLDPARSPRESAGFGLGLTIVRQLVELQGGQVLAESEPGKGSRFGFRLPLAQPGEET